MSLLQSLGQDLHERAAVLSRLHKMWASYDVLRRPEIAYLMCQLGDRSGVEAVSRAFFAGDYTTRDGNLSHTARPQAQMRLTMLSAC